MATQKWYGKVDYLDTQEARKWVGVGVRGNWRRFWTTEGFPGNSKGKESACSAGDLGLIPGLARSSREGNGNPLQHSCLENPTDRGAWQATVHGVTKSQTWLSDSHTHTHTHTHTEWHVCERVSVIMIIIMFLVVEIKKIMYYLEPKYIEAEHSLWSTGFEIRQNWIHIEDPPLSIQPRLRSPGIQWLRAGTLQPPSSGVNASSAVDVVLFFWASVALSIKCRSYYLFHTMAGRIKWILLGKLFTTCLLHCMVINKR